MGGGFNTSKSQALYRACALQFVVPCYPFAMTDPGSGEATGLYDVNRLAALLGVTPATIRTMRSRNQLPVATSENINGGAVWAQEIVDACFAPKRNNVAGVEPDPCLPQVVDLFSGCGGMSLGFQIAGFDVIHGLDNWQCAVDTYTANLGHDGTLLDLSDVQETIRVLKPIFEAAEHIPAIIGGPPCQDFSSAGKRVEGQRADLTEKYAYVVSYFEPPFFVMENVARAKGSGAYQRALDTLRAAGYSVGTIVLNADRCGVPQTRKRLIAVGSKDEAKTKRIMELLVENQSDTPMTLRDYFGDRLGTDHYYRHPRSYSRRGVFSIDEPSPTVRGVNRPIPAGYPGHPGDSAPITKARPLTTAERAEIQTFPPGFTFVGSRTNTEQMVGNAVPVRLAKFIGDQIAATWREGDGSLTSSPP